MGQMAMHSSTQVHAIFRQYFFLARGLISYGGVQFRNCVSNCLAYSACSQCASQARDRNNRCSHALMRTLKVRPTTDSRLLDLTQLQIPHNHKKPFVTHISPSPHNPYNLHNPRSRPKLFERKRNKNQSVHMLSSRPVHSARDRDPLLKPRYAKK